MAGQYEKAEDKKRFFGPLLAKVGALPGVLAASEISGLPPFGGYSGEIEIPGRTHTEKWRSMCQLVSEGYPQALGLKLGAIALCALPVVAGWLVLSMALGRAQERRGEQLGEAVRED